MLFALNQGEVCTCQSRLLVQEDIYEKFMERVVARTEAIQTGNPLDDATMMGAQVSQVQQERIVNYIAIGTAEGAKVLTGGAANNVLTGGYYIKPTSILMDTDGRTRDVAHNLASFCVEPPPPPRSRAGQSSAGPTR